MLSSTQQGNATNHLRTSLRVTTLLLASLSGGQALSQTILLDQPPSQTTTLWSHALVESNVDQFVVPSEGATVTDFTIWGSWTTTGAQQADTFNVYFHADAAGAPGATIATFLGVSPTVTATGLSFAGVGGAFPEFKLDFDLPGGPTLAPGIVWIEVYSTGSSGSGENFAWEMAPLDAARGLPCMGWSLQTPGVTWNLCTPLPETDMALLIHGASGPVGTPYCFGDGSATTCPCGNTGGAGEGCANGTGAGAILSNSGSASIATGNLVLIGSQLPLNQPGLYFQGENRVNGGSGLAFGDGLRCAGGGVVRLQTVSASGAGDSSTSIDIGVAGGVSAGDTKRYQLWYRDPVGSPCGNVFNLSNGLEVTWAL